MIDIEKSVLQTICYADIFDYPLSMPEIHHFLISSTPQNQSSVKQAVSRLLSTNAISLEADQIFLSGRKSLIAKKIIQFNASQKKLSLAHKIALHLSTIKDLQAIFLTGAVAMNNAKKVDDIDLMFITSPNKLWTVRWHVIRALDGLGVRRKPKMTAVKNLICPNIFVTTNALKVDSPHQSLYTAHEVAQTKPLYDPHHIHSLFFSQNNWVKHYLANYMTCLKNQQPSTNFISVNALDFRERAMYFLQKAYMRHRRTTEDIQLEKAFFHPRPTHQTVLHEYQKRISVLGLDNSVT